MKNLLKRGGVELVASALFTLAYFILLGRTQSQNFSLNILELSALISFIYVIAVFVSSFRFEADLFPFFSLLRCFFEKSWTPLWLNIPAQFLGTLVGFGLYLSIHDSLLTLSPFAETGSLVVFEINNLSMRSLTIAVLVFILTYSMLIIRKLFKLEGMTGTLLISILVFVLSAISLPVQDVSVVTWWQDTVLNVYYYATGLSDNAGFNLFAVVTALVVLGTLFIANIKASQYIRPNSEESGYEEPGEVKPSFSKDYDI